MFRCLFSAHCCHWWLEAATHLWTSLGSPRRRRRWGCPPGSGWRSRWCAGGGWLTSPWPRCSCGGWCWCSSSPRRSAAAASPRGPARSRVCPGCSCRWCGTWSLVTHLLFYLTITLLIWVPSFTPPNLSSHLHHPALTERVQAPGGTFPFIWSQLPNQLFAAVYRDTDTAQLANSR